MAKELAQYLMQCYNECMWNGIRHAVVFIDKVHWVKWCTSSVTECTMDCRAHSRDVISTAVNHSFQRIIFHGMRQSANPYLVSDKHMTCCQGILLLRHFTWHSCSLRFWGAYWTQQNGLGQNRIVHNQINTYLLFGWLFCCLNRLHPDSYSNLYDSGLLMKAKACETLQALTAISS